jgi:hypothetical protein
LLRGVLDQPQGARTDLRQSGRADISARLPISAHIVPPPPLSEPSWRRQRNSLIVASLRD